MRDRLRGNTEQGLDFIHQRVYGVGLAQGLEALQDDVLAGLFWADSSLAPVQIETTPFLLLSEKHERVGAADVEHWGTWHKEGSAVGGFERLVELAVHKKRQRQTADLLEGRISVIDRAVIGLPIGELAIFALQGSMQRRYTTSASSNLPRCSRISPS
jgi:hypothetical protein